MSWQEDLAPRAVWEHFYQLTQIPRPSHHEERISAFLARFGRELGLETTVDEVGDVLIRKPASAGMANRPGVILQAHMDMVPEKAPGKIHDFATDPSPPTSRRAGCGPTAPRWAPTTASAWPSSWRCFGTTRSRMAP